MPLSRGLSLWIYPSALTSTPPQGLRNYRSVVSDLSFTTVSPGGWGTLTATLKLGAKYLAQPEFQLFARVALVGRGFPAFLGELSDITVSGDGKEESISITALGLGNCLRDDPANSSYSAQTAKSIINDQFNVGGVARQNYNWPMSFNMDQVFPDNPGTTYTLSYAWRNVEEILNDVCTLAGGYAWTVFEHPTTKDLLGFPQGWLQVHTKDITTTNYIAAIGRGDVARYEIAQSSDRAYNRIAVGYNEPSSGAPSFVTATDSRLAGSGAINVAPFRRRAYVRDFAGNSAASSAAAQVVANQLLAQYKSGANKVQMTLSAVRDKNNAHIPLYMVRADANIHMPDLGGRGLTAPAAATAGVNQFYILKSTYQESGGNVTLQLECDNYANDADILIARLQYMAERMARTGSRTTEALQAVGAAVKGWANVSFQASAGGQQFSLQGTTFRPILYQAPSSISWAAATYQVNNAGNPTVNNITQYGFNAIVGATASGAGSYGGNFTTVGNCIYDLDLVAGTFTHHHGACGLLRTGLSIKDNVIVEYDAAGQPGMRVECPCGGGEAYNLDLGALREREGEQIDDGRVYHNSMHDAVQARHIRAMMRHPHVGLHAFVRDCDCAECVKPKEKTKRSPRRAVNALAPVDGLVVGDAIKVNHDAKGRTRTRRAKDPLTGEGAAAI